MRAYDNIFKMRYPNERAYTDERFLIYLQRDSQFIAYFYIQELAVRYKIYDEEYMTIDLSDYVRTLNDEVTITVNALSDIGDVLHSFSFSSRLYSGISTNVEILPLKENFVCDLNDTTPMLMRIKTAGIIQKFIGGTWTDLRPFGANEWVNDFMTVGQYRVVVDGDDLIEFQIKVYENCRQENSIPLDWLSENGLRKRWTFPITTEVRRTLSSTELERPNDGYTLIKNKGVEINVKEDQADMSLRMYLADLVYSSDITTEYIDEFGDLVTVPVTVSGTSHNVTLTEKYQDVTFTLKVGQYDSF